MSEMKPIAWMRGALLSFYEPINGRPLYTADQLAEAVSERDALIRDLRKELNERHYGRSAAK